MVWNCPTAWSSDRGTLTDTYGKFVAEPFERGFGVTVGNSLRRILLSSLEGSAVTRVKIQGVQHEISTIPGVVEDVTDIILNIKSLVVKNLSDQPKTIRIDRHEQGVVTAADIITDETVQIINPEHIIATLTDDVPFVVEMTVENGRGYRTADENAGKEREIGVIPVDSQLLAGRPRQVRDRGHPRRPEDELRQAGHGDLDQRHDHAADGPGRRGQDPPQAPQPVHPVRRAGAGDRRSTTASSRRAGGDTVDHELERKLNMSLAELELSVRATNCLESEGITTVRDLVIRTDEELLEVRNFGETTLQGSEAKLAERGLTLGMRIPPNDDSGRVTMI